MKIRMLEFAKGSNGIKTKEYKIGMVYNVPSDLSQYLAVAWLQRSICQVHNPMEDKIEVKKVVPNKSILERVKELVKPGITNVSIAEELGISVNELKELKKKL